MENYRVRFGTFEGVKLYTVYEDNIPLEDYAEEKKAQERAAHFNRIYNQIQRRRIWES